MATKQETKTATPATTPAPATNGNGKRAPKTTNPYRDTPDAELQTIVSTANGKIAALIEGRKLALRELMRREMKGVRARLKGKAPAADAPKA